MEAILRVLTCLFFVFVYKKNRQANTNGLLFFEVVSVVHELNAICNKHFQLGGGTNQLIVFPFIQTRKCHRICEYVKS